MVATAPQIGTEVRYAETHRGLKWVKIGTVVEVTETRARVLWDRWEFDDGKPAKKDNKRTWVAIKRLSF